MSKVLIVNQSTGKAQAIDTEGNPTTFADGMLSSFDATTTMNRLAEGYVLIPYDHYAIRLDIVSEVGKEGWETLMFTDMVILKSDGSPHRLRFTDIESIKKDQFLYDHHIVVLAKLDTENDTISWANNPLEAEAYTFSFDAAPKVIAETQMEEMLYLFRNKQAMSIEPAEVLVTTYIENWL